MEELRKLQSELTMMISDVDGLLKENNIRYFLLGGSVLGAVRHKGFIPWDDDMDIAVFRPDFHKAEELLSGLDKYVYEPADSHVIPDAPVGHLHYVNERYPIENSPTIDVFALDGAGATEKDWRKQRRIANWYHLAILGRPAKNRGFLSRLATALLLSFIPSKVWAEIKRLSFKKITSLDVSISPYIANLFGAWGYKEFFRREMFDTCMFGEFEGLVLPLPANPHEYLTQLYGDYMRLPPAEARRPRHRKFF